ncbi:MAG: transposase family protein [Methylococcales bacterium]|nr:transposase family protein [Methylococcales bacterium]
MTDQPIASIIHHFSNIEDPRIEKHKKHLLSDMFFITLCATSVEQITGLP